MSKEICISTTPHETRLAILENDELTEIYYERENEYTLAGSIYKGKVTRVLPGMQSAFVDIGLERDAFLYVTDFLEEQDDGADFERAEGGGQKPRREPVREGAREGSREGGREAGPNREPRARQAEAAPVPPAVVTEPLAEDDSEDADSPAGTKRWRGRRGRKRGFRPRGGQEEGQTAAAADSHEIEERPPVAPPAQQQYISRTAAPEYSPRPAAPAPTQRILLPGEALSKYGAMPASTPGAASGSDAVALPAAFKTNAAPNYTAPKPSTLIDVPLQWDGGDLLPGESRARNRGSANSEPSARLEAPAVEPVSEGWAFESQAPEARTVPLAVDEPAEVEAASEVEAPFEVEASGIVEPRAEISETVAETAHVATEAPVAEYVEPVVSEPAELVHEVHDAVVEVQESEAEVNVPELKYEPEAHFETELHDEAELSEEVHEFEPESASASHRINPVAPSEFRVSSVVEEDAPPAEIEHEAGHENSPHNDAVHEAAPVEAHSVEVVVEHPIAEVEYEDEVTDSEAADPLFGFAPGAGVLEEEEIDEDEYDFEPIHAGADEQDIEDLEEETLDHTGPEIGEMVREAHLNKRLLVGNGIELEEEEDETDEPEFGDADVDEESEDEEDEGEAAEHEGDAVAQNASGESAAPRRDSGRDPGRDSDRSGQRRGGRRGDRHGERRGGQQGGRGRHGGGGRRPSAQTMDLPIISDLLKQGQEILVQIAKEPIAKKGARITSHIALPGRFLVFMPTVNHVGVSRKISSDEERQRLKRILISEKGEASGGFIVRTAADGASEEELRADLRFLISLWNDIKQREEGSRAPALIYHDLNLVERVLRDQVSDNFSTIWVDSESEYERTVRFLNRFQPSLVRRVKLYTKETPLFEHFGIQDEISKALKSKVWLKSGGSIVINQTEALVAIDINTGKYVGKTARLEDTILKTNLDAIPEIVRQIRLRDLGGIIVIDFIDMDERRNRHKVMQALEDELKNDRAPSKVLQFNDFGLVAITRKRVKQSLERTLSIPCAICTGTGMVKSPSTVANEIYVEMRKMQKHLDRGDVMLRVNPEVVKTLKANNAKWLNELEEMVGKTIIVKSDATLHPEQFDIH